MNQHSIPAVWMRGGTSKGLFFNRKDLPEDDALRDKLLLDVIGSSRAKWEMILWESPNAATAEITFPDI